MIRQNGCWSSTAFLRNDLQVAILYYEPRKKTVTKVTVFFQRCVPQAERDVSELKCASARDTEHITSLRPYQKTFRTDFYSCFLEWIYSLGDIPYCFLKALLKYEMLSNPHSRAMSIILSVVFNSIDSTFCSFNKRQYS